MMNRLPAVAAGAITVPPVRAARYERATTQPPASAAVVVAVEVDRPTNEAAVIAAEAVMTMAVKAGPVKLVPEVPAPVWRKAFQPPHCETQP